MKNLRYICVQPQLVYYAWQLEVMIESMLQQGVNGNKLEILVAYTKSDTFENGTYSETNRKLFRNLANKYNYVRFFFYEDTRESRGYIPSIYFNILKQHIKAFPELENEALFLFDCDTVFTKPLDLTQMQHDDKWYLSDTVGYIGYQYIKTKAQDDYDVYNGMCKIIGIDPLIPKLLNSQSGGAQHLVKNTTYEYWDKVERDAERLYQYFNEIEPHYKSARDGDHPIQKWTAGMWSLLWNAWLFEHETVVDDRLAFSWATDPIEYWDQRAIYHNAGVTCACNQQFFKGAYVDKLPYGEDIRVKNTKCNYRYYQKVVEVGKTSCLIDEVQSNTKDNPQAPK